MTNKEFIELSEKEVKQLNGSIDEFAQESWRAGYNYLAKKIGESIDTKFYDEFMTEMEEIASSNLEVFRFNV